MKKEDETHATKLFLLVAGFYMVAIIAFLCVSHMARAEGLDVKEIEEVQATLRFRSQFYSKLYSEREQEIVDKLIKDFYENPPKKRRDKALERGFDLINQIR